jgi:hypothetical protein
MLSGVLPLLQKWKPTTVTCSGCCATGGLAYFLTRDSWCVTTIYTVRQWGWLPVARFGRGWYVICGSVLNGFGSGFPHQRVGGCLRGSCGGIWRVVCWSVSRWFVSLGVRSWPISLVVGRSLVGCGVYGRLISFISRRWFVSWDIRKGLVGLAILQIVRRCIRYQIVWSDSRRGSSWEGRRIVGGWFIGYMRTVCGRRVGRRCVSRPRLGRRGGCWAIIIKQLELASRRVIVSIWRAVLLIWIVWRVV